MARKNNNGEKGMDGVEKAAILLIALVLKNQQKYSNI